MESLKVRDYMDPQPVVITADMNIYEAVALFINQKISGITVVNDKKEVVGMLSELDCLKSTLHCSYMREMCGKVEDFMTKKVDTIGPEDNILELAKVFEEHKRRRFPVVEEGRLVGQLSCRNLLQAVHKFAQQN